MQSTDEYLRERSSDAGGTGDADGDRRDAGTARSAGGRGGVRSRVRRRVGRVFSPRGFLLALVLTVAAVFLANAVVPVFGGLAGYVGVFAVGFLLGVGRERRQYLEIGAAGAVAAGVSALLGHLVLSIVGGLAVPVTFLGASAGFALAIVGHYFGRDLRDGLTRDL